MNLDAQLAELEQAQLVRQLLDEELTYVFKHALVQDTAYESLLKQDRKQLHRVVGEALECAYPEQLDEYAALLARHFAQAEEREKAVDYARRAARRAVERYAYGEAADQLRRALELMHGASESRRAVLEELGDVHRLLREGMRALAWYRESLGVWNDLSNADKQIAVRLHRKIVETVSEIKWAIDQDEFHAERQASVSSLASLESEGRSLGGAPHPEMARLLTALSISAWRIQSPPDWDAALRYAQAAVEIAEKLDHPAESSAPLDALATAYFARGRLRENLRVSLQRLAISREAQFDDVRARLDSLRGAGSALMYVGEYRQALAYLRQAAEIAQRVQAIDQQFNTLALESQCYFRLDHWDDVLKTEARIRDLERLYPREKTGPT